MTKRQLASKARSIKAKPLGFAVAFDYRKRPGGPAYAHRFGPRVRVGVIGRYLVVGPVSVKSGDIRG